MKLLIILYCFFFIACSSKKALKVAQLPDKKETKKRIKKEKKAKTHRSEDSKIHLKLNRIQLSDSFIDEIKSKKFDRVDLLLKGEKKKVYRRIPKWRVQLAAFSQKNEAEKLVDKINSKLSIKPYILNEKNLYKVQVGNYDIRAQADQLLFELKKKNILTAWVVKSFEEEEVKAKDSSKIDRDLYRVQIASFKEKARADSLKSKLSREISELVIVLKSKNLFKVFVAAAKQKEDLISIEKKLSALGYKTWIHNRY